MTDTDTTTTPDTAAVVPAEDLAAHIAAGIPGVSAEQAAAVLAAVAEVQAGEPLDTVRKDPDSGELAHRISLNGVHLWRISKSNGEQWFDKTPTLPAWTLLFSAGVGTPSP